MVRQPGARGQPPEPLDVAPETGEPSVGTILSN